MPLCKGVRGGRSETIFLEVVLILPKRFHLADENQFLHVAGHDKSGQAQSRSLVQSKISQHLVQKIRRKLKTFSQ